MDLSSLQTHCLAKPGVTQGHPFGPGVLVMKVAGKVFAIIGEDAEPMTISLKCDPVLAIVLREEHQAVQPGYHLNKRHWNTVTLDGTIVAEEVRDWIDDSYDLVVQGLPRRIRDELRHRPSA
jgi:predicted DNA-binding protein (MmcQ/YjbR family)